MSWPTNEAVWWVYSATILSIPNVKGILIASRPPFGKYSSRDWGIITAWKAVGMGVRWKWKWRYSILGDKMCLHVATLKCPAMGRKVGRTGIPFLVKPCHCSSKPDCKYIYKLTKYGVKALLRWSNNQWQPTQRNQMDSSLSESWCDCGTNVQTVHIVCGQLSHWYKFPPFWHRKQN